MQVDIQVPDKFKNKKAIKEDTVLQTLATSSNEEINIWVDNNINNLDDAKSLFKKIIKVLRYTINNL